MDTPIVPPFELTEDEKKDDPELLVVRPGRTSVAFGLIERTYNAALGDHRGIDAKATAVIGWIAAIFAIALFQNIGSKSAPVSHPDLVLLSFVFLILSLFAAIRIHRSQNVWKAGLLDPLDVYGYQSAVLWDHTHPTGFTVDQVAEAQTQLYLIQETSKAIQRLGEATGAKQRLLVWSHRFFAAGIVFLALSLCLPAHFPQSLLPPRSQAVNAPTLHSHPAALKPSQPGPSMPPSKPISSPPMPAKH